METKLYALILFLISFTFQSNTCIAQDKTIQEKVDQYIDSYIQMNQFSGCILVAKEGQILVNKAYGYASYEFDIRNTPNTKFRIGSLTKGFTAVSILQLEEQGLLSVADKLNKYIADYPEGERITLEHLLNNTSGIKNHTEFPDFNSERRVYRHNLEETIQTFKNKELEFNPGEKFTYSNSNYILLGYVIEKVTNISYADYIEQNIFEPLGMTDSGFEYPDEVIKNFAQGYGFTDNKITKARFRDMSNAHASGAIYSTIEDLLTWDRALYSDKLISTESKNRMFYSSEYNYGYGWGIIEVFNRKMIAHSGEIEGFVSNISRFVDDEITIVILSNFEHTPLNRINRDLIAILFGEKYDVPEINKTIKLSNETLKTYVGDYELQPGFVFSISFLDGSLYCQPTGQPKLLLAPISESVFILSEVNAKISFEKNSKLEIEKLILHQGEKQFPAPKIK